MFTIGTKVKIKSSGTLGLVVEANAAEIVITTKTGTFPYNLRCAKRYLEIIEDHACSCLPRETTELRNVITGLSLKDMQGHLGPAHGALEFNYRATGRSSGIALRWLAACIEEPYVWLKAKDHPMSDRDATHYMNKELQVVAQRIVDALGWRGFEYHKEQGIRFVPIVKEVTTYESKTVVTSLR